MSATRRLPSPTCAPAPEPGVPATVAHRIRDRVSALAYALEVIRITAGDERKLAACLAVAGRQIDALTRLANELDDPGPANPEPEGGPPPDAPGVPPP